MTFDDIFKEITKKAAHAHAGAVPERVAVEINVTGEGAGVFYIEIRNRILYIQPQRYPGCHLRITLSGKTLMALLHKETDIKTEWLSGNVKMSGDLGKLKYLKRIEL